MCQDTCAEDDASCQLGYDTCSLTGTCSKQCDLANTKALMATIKAGGGQGCNSTADCDVYGPGKTCVGAAGSLGRGPWAG